jgi:hypothetical protein
MPSTRTLAAVESTPEAGGRPCSSLPPSRALQKSAVEEVHRVARDSGGIEEPGCAACSCSTRAARRLTWQTLASGRVCHSRTSSVTRSVTLLRNSRLTKVKVLFRVAQIAESRPTTDSAGGRGTARRHDAVRHGGDGRLHHRRTRGRVRPLHRSRHRHHAQPHWTLRTANSGGGSRSTCSRTRSGTDHPHDLAGTALEPGSCDGRPAAVLAPIRTRQSDPQHLDHWPVSVA